MKKQLAAQVEDKQDRFTDMISYACKAQQTTVGHGARAEKAPHTFIHMFITIFISTFKQATKFYSSELDASNISTSSEPKEIIMHK